MYTANIPVDMIDIVKHDGCARGIHQDTADAPCADTQTLASPDRCPQLEPKETSMTSPAPGGAANLTLAMAMVMVLTAAKRQAKQQGNPRCLTLSDRQGTATTTSSSAADAAFSDADACKRDGVTRGVARGSDAGASWLATQGHGDQHG